MFDPIRFQRQISLNQIGPNGQTNLLNSKALIVGMGGLGNPISMYLASAGIGTIGVIDYDTVSLSNLHRQILFSEENVGTNKALAAQHNLKKFNSNTNVIAYPYQLTSEIADDLFAQYDIIIDACDDFETKLLINDFSFNYSKPFIYGSIDQFEGHVGIFNLHNGPCFRCVYPQKPKARIQTCESAGVLGSFAGIVAGIQATESILYLANPLNVTKSKFIHLDFSEMPKIHTFEILKNSNCKTCTNTVNAQHHLNIGKENAPVATHSLQ